MINNVSLTGRLTSDLEVMKTQTGKSVVSFTLAVGRVFDKDKTDFIRCVAWEKTADFMGTYLGKGSLIGLEGHIETRTYDKNGQTVFLTEVIASKVVTLETKAQREENLNNNNNYNNNNNQQKTYSKPKEEQPINISSDDLPF